MQEDEGGKRTCDMHFSMYNESTQQAWYANHRTLGQSSNRGAYCARLCVQQVLHVRSNIMDLKNKRGKVLHHKLPPRLVDSYGRLPTTPAQYRKTKANLRKPILAKRIAIARARRIEAERIRVGALRRRTASFLILSHNELARRAQGFARRAQARRAQGKTDKERFGSDRFKSRFSLVTCRLRKTVDCVRVAKSKRKCQVHKSTFCHAIQGYGDAAYTGMPNVPSVHAPTRAEKDMCKTFPDACAFTTVMN